MVRWYHSHEVRVFGLVAEHVIGGRGADLRDLEDAQQVGHHYG